MSFTSVDTERSKWGRIVDLSVLATATYLSDMFEGGDGQISDTEEVVFDVVERGNQAAEPQVVGGEGHGVKWDTWTQRTIVPPEYHEFFVLTGSRVRGRQPGELPTAERSNLDREVLAQISSQSAEVLNRFRRGIEVQAATILTTGLFTAKTDTYDFQVPATHLVTTGTPWSTHATATPIVDLESMMDAIRISSGRTPTQITFGSGAWADFTKCATVRDHRLKYTVPEAWISVNVQPPANNGAKYVGKLMLGSTMVEMYVYDALYQNAAGANIPYLPADKVLVHVPGSRWVRHSAQVPKIVEADPRVAQYSPGLVVSTETQIPYFQRASPEGADAIRVDLKTRTALNPVDNKTFGCLDTIP